MLRVGLTGGIGAGKSAVARLLSEHGARVIDADVLAREVVARGTDGLARIAAEFGDRVLRADGELDRAGLGRLVFADDDARRRLNAIVHPLVAERTAELMAEAPPAAVVVHDVPLLTENKLAPGYDIVIVVEAPPADRLARLSGRGLAEPEARSRIAAQATDEQRRAIADVVIANDSDLDELGRRVAAVWRDRIEPLRAEH
ncbi:MAG TPA: dephospho-CoA kinase [Mycobacteriales bacterium]|nr:dephospho-CoA kinase [Mycobacteriales bacterium]